MIYSLKFTKLSVVVIFNLDSRLIVAMVTATNICIYVYIVNKLFISAIKIMIG